MSAKYRIKSPWKVVSDSEKETVWSRPAKSGGTVKMWRTADKDGVEEFWLSTHDSDGHEAGPQTTPEVWTPFDVAVAEGDKLAAMDWRTPAP